MIKVNIVAVGKVKEKYFVDGIAEYSKRLNRFCEFNLIEVPEENYSKVDDKLIQKIIEKESQNLMPHLKGYIFVTAIEGKKFSSKKFSEQIKSLVDDGIGNLTFVIGGSYGLSNEIKNKANCLISFSDMTFPHTFFRMMLTEQIYRAFCIIEGTPYHK